MNMQKKFPTGDALRNSPLGRRHLYPDQYDSNLLFGVPRTAGRASLGLPGRLPFVGVDIWNIYELSWLEPDGRPVCAMAELRVPVDSPRLIESKSMKLYFNSLNMTTFANMAEVQRLLVRDLTTCAGAPVGVQIRPGSIGGQVLADPQGSCIDESPFGRHHAEPCSSLLKSSGDIRNEVLFSRLFRSRCPVTGQPDWATVIVDYAGPAIKPGALLDYLVSYRRHQSFHEACVEQVFVDIWRQCRPEKLEVTARFTRRGGIDINPVRSSHDNIWRNVRTPFQ